MLGSQIKVDTVNILLFLQIMKGTIEKYGLNIIKKSGLDSRRPHHTTTEIFVHSTTYDLIM